jgi:hypothetical protein
MRRPLHVAAIDDELLIWDPESESVHRLNPSAAAAWRILVTTAGAAQTSADAGLTPHEFEECRIRFAAEELLGRAVTGRF